MDRRIVRENRVADFFMNIWKLRRKILSLQTEIYIVGKIQSQQLVRVLAEKSK